MSKKFQNNYTSGKKKPSMGIQNKEKFFIQSGKIKTCVGENKKSSTSGVQNLLIYINFYSGK